MLKLLISLVLLPVLVQAYTINEPITLLNYPSTGYTFKAQLTGEIKDTSVYILVTVLQNSVPSHFPSSFTYYINATPEPINWSVDSGPAGYVFNNFYVGTNSAISITTNNLNLFGYGKPLPSGSGILTIGVPVPTVSPLQVRKILEIPYRNGKVVDLSTTPTSSVFSEIGVLGKKFINKSETLVGDPVNITDGTFYDEETDLVIPGAYPIVWTKRYTSSDTTGRELGRNWKSNHPSFLEVTGAAITASDASGNILEFTQNSIDPNLWEVTELANPLIRTLPKNATLHLRETITKTVESGITVYTHINPVTGLNARYEVQSFPLEVIPGTTVTRARPYLVKKQDTLGNYLQYTYETNPLLNGYGQIKQITNNSGESLVLTYNSNDVITQLTASDGRVVTYSYTTPGTTYYQLATTIRPESTTTFSYDTDGQILVVNKPDTRKLNNTYVGGKVTQQQATLTSATPVTNAKFVYTSGKTTAENILGNKSEHEHTGGKLTKVVDRNGQTQVYDWYSTTDPLTGAYVNALKSSTSPIGATTTYTYTAEGNVATTTLTQTP